MKLIAILILAPLTCIGAYAADRTFSPDAGAVHIVTAEPGVIPAGAMLVVRASDTVNTRRAYRGTIYEGKAAEDIVDENGGVLIPRNSPVELVVRSFPYLGPGGVGMTGLTLRAEAITVRGTRYPIATVGDTMNAGGIRADAVRIIGAEGSAVHASGSRVYVPANSLLEFQVEDPIRLSGYQR